MEGLRQLDHDADQRSDGAAKQVRHVPHQGAYEPMRARGVEFTQEPTDRYGAVDASFRDPSGNGWKLIEGR